MMDFDKIIGQIAPNVCLGCGVEGSVLCGQCLVNAGEPPVSRCAGCRKLTKNYKTCSSCIGWLNIYAVYVATNYEGIYEQLVRALKFDMKRSAVEPIATILTDKIAILPSNVVVCPLPTAPTRIRQRGFDHAKLITKAYMGKLPKDNPWAGWNYQNLLLRKTNVRQLGSSRAKRIAQMEEEFLISKKVDVKGKTILLIDDVMTTGASLSAGAKTLKSGGAKRVYATVFAQKS